MDNKDPYPDLLGIEWAFSNAAIINWKRETMTFEVDGTRVNLPLDPYQGTRYIEPVDEAMEQDVVIRSITWLQKGREDYVNPTADGSISWRSMKSLDGDSEEALCEC